MKKSLLVKPYAFIFLFSPFVQAMTLDQEAEKISYVLGMEIGQSLKGQKIELNPYLLGKGVEDSLKDLPLLVSEEEKRRIFLELQSKILKEKEAFFKQVASENLEKSRSFLAANAIKNEIKLLEDTQIQYQPITMGKGPSPKHTDTVLIHYHAYLMDGTEFDSSYKRNEPLKVSLENTMPGWAYALQKMPKGSTWILWIPPEKAYGEIGAPSMGIGPNEVLKFEVSLMEIIPSTTTPTGEKKTK